MNDVSAQLSVSGRPVPEYGCTCGAQYSEQPLHLQFVYFLMEKFLCKPQDRDDWWAHQAEGRGIRYIMDCGVIHVCVCVFVAGSY